jgi:putative transposase
MQDTVLTEQLRALHAESDETYGAPRLREALRQAGTPIAKKRVARLMRAAGLRGVSRRRAFTVTTQRDKERTPAPDFVNREFVADGPNQLWVADMTYIPTWSGVLYLAMVLDAWSRRVVGWAFGEQMTADLVIAAMNMALAQRKPRSVIHHSDQGSQYTSLAFGKRCKEMGVQPSMGSVGDAYDNAMAESFFATLECELIDRRCWQTRAQARVAVFTYIEAWYNPRRLHSALAYRSPMQFEAAHAELMKHNRRPRSEHGLPTAGACVAAATPAVDSPALVLTEPA